MFAYHNGIAGICLPFNAIDAVDGKLKPLKNRNADKNHLLVLCLNGYKNKSDKKKGRNNMV